MRAKNTCTALSATPRFPAFERARERLQYKLVCDLKGKTVVLTETASNEFYVTNKWNKEHGRPFKIIFESTCALRCEDIASGKAGATVSTAQDFERWNREYGARLRIVQPAVYNADTYYVLNKRTVAELQKTFDAALKELKDDGALNKLSLQGLGGDFTAERGVSEGWHKKVGKAFCLLALKMYRSNGAARATFLAQ